MKIDETISPNNLKSLSEGWYRKGRKPNIDLLREINFGFMLLKNIWLYGKHIVSWFTLIVIYNSNQLNKNVILVAFSSTAWTTNK